MVTPIRTAAQADYRLSLECGADEIRAADVAVEYRLAVDEHDPIVRLGNGWHEFDIEPGTALESEADIEGMRQIMAGRDPRTGERLVTFKSAVAPDAMLAARPFVEAVRAAATERGTTPAGLLKASGWSTKRFARLERGLVRDGDGHRAPVGDLARVATAAGIDLEAVYERGELGHALEHADERVDIGTRGYDITFTRPRKVDVVQALAPPEMAARMEAIHDQAVAETMRHVEQWVAYSMTGHHGDGQSAERVDTTGLIATATKHRTARPVDGGPGDPHTHTHVMMSVMGRSVVDGKWRTVAAGGRELMRHTATMGELQRAIERHLLSSEFGFRFERDAASGRWDLAGVPDHVKAAFSRRQVQALAEAGDGASSQESRAAARRTAQAKVHSTRDQERASWARRTQELGYAPLELVRAALEGREPGGPAAGHAPGGPGPVGPPDIEALAAAVWDPEHGVTSKDKTVTRAKVMAAVASACEGGLMSGEELALLTDDVLAHGEAVPLPDSGAAHMTHSDRYTSLDIVRAEETITEAARRRHYDLSASVHFKTVLRSMRAWERKKGLRLSDEQRKVVLRLTFMCHGIDTVVGVAGAGKTTIMSAARAIWESAGHRVEGVANAAVAAAALRADAGIDSGTVAALLHRIENGRGLWGVNVLVLDEAATIDDRALAAIVTEANRTGTKLVGIGDPLQARSVGAGGSFARVHEIVEGLELTENRRQRGKVDRKALERWREGARRSALALWGENGMVHAPVDADAAHRQITAAWATDRDRYADPHQAVERLVVMAPTNADVDALNIRLRAAARTQGRLTGQEVSYHLPGGRRLDLAAGDQVRIRQNDYRSRRDPAQPDVLNGFRGVVLEVDERRGAHVEWRADGHTQRAWVRPDQVSQGALTHGYAITVASAQGLTVDRAHVYGLGADAHTLYPAMSRAKDRVDLYLPANQVEPETVRARLGEARTKEEALHRTISAYAATLTDGPEPMVLDELAGGRQVRQERERAVATRAEQAAAATPPTPWQPLSLADANAGRGPAYRQTVPEVAKLHERIEAVDRSLPELRQRAQDSERRAEKGRLALLVQGTTKSEAQAERDAARAEVQRAAAEREQLRAQVERMRQEALRADRSQVRADQERVRQETEIARLEKGAHVLDVTRGELERMDRVQLDRLRTWHTMQAISGRHGTARHEDRVQVPAATTPEPSELHASHTRGMDMDEYRQRLTWEIEQEEQERRDQQQRERDYQRQQVQEQQREYQERAQREAAYRAAERSGPELGL
ncbi:MobF family relaxase [Nocardiopsis dassonvillei]|uniref:MobF family relaxase n=1 Tax=Nocardiopsis dassonvillei TaxID=2014 RepID=UPI0033E2865F